MKEEFIIPKISHKELNDDPNMVTIDNKFNNINESLEIIEDNTRHGQLLKIENINLEINNLKKEINLMNTSLTEFKIDLNFVNEEIEKEGEISELMTEKHRFQTKIDNLRYKINLKENKILNLKNITERNLIDSN